MRDLKNVSFNAALILSIVFMLGGCVATEPTATQTPVGEATEPAKTKIETPEEVIQAQAGLTPKQRMTKALDALDKGQTQVAYAELQEYLVTFPNSPRANKLVNQIKTPISDFYPEDFFSIELESGQSLSTLSKKYLGSPWEFYALAKYNDIAVPNKVNIGDEIKIPLTQLARSVREKETLAAEEQADIAIENPVSSETDAITEKLEELEKEKALQDETTELNTEALLDNISDEVQSAASLQAEIETAIASQNYVQAYQKLKSLEEFEAPTVSLSDRVIGGKAKALANENPQLSSQRYTELAEIYSQQQNELKAYENYKLAAETDPNNVIAKENMEMLKLDITSRYHREASVAFRQQALDEAIRLWGIVLDIDPEHTNASAYQIQAMELKDRLEALKQ